MHGLRCVGCGTPHMVVMRGEDAWCVFCIEEGKLAAFLEELARVTAILAERGRRIHDVKIPTPRDDKRFKPAEQRNDEKV